MIRIRFACATPFSVQIELRRAESSVYTYANVTRFTK